MELWIRADNGKKEREMAQDQFKEYLDYFRILY